MFKDLVQSILKYDRDKSVITMKVIETLKQDIRNDITNAFDLALPLISSHRDLYSRSSSFTDFLFKMCRINLGSDDDEQDRRVDAVRSCRDRLDAARDADPKRIECEQKLSTATAELTTMSQETERMKTELSSLQSQVDQLEEDGRRQTAQLRTASEENEKMKTMLSKRKERLEQYERETERSNGAKKSDSECQTTVIDGTSMKQRDECGPNGIGTADAERSFDTELERILSECGDIYRNASVYDHLRETATCTAMRGAEGMKTEWNPPSSTFVERFESFRDALQDTFHGLDKKARAADDMLRALRVPEHAPPHSIPKKLELLRRRVPEALWFNPTWSDVPGAKELSLALLRTRLGTLDLAKKIDDDPDSETHRSTLLKRIRRVHGETLARDFDLNAVIRDDPELEETRRQLVRTLTAAHGLDMAFYDPTEAIGDADLDDSRREILEILDLRSMVGVTELGVKDERPEPRMSDEEIAELQSEILDLNTRIEQQKTAADLEHEKSRREHDDATQAAVEEVMRLREEEVGLTKSILQAETERLKGCLERASGAEDENLKLTIEIASLKETNDKALYESNRRTAAERHIGERLEEITRAFTDIYTNASVFERPHDAAQGRQKRESSPDAETRPSLDALVASLDAARENTQSVVHGLDKKARVADDMLRALRVPEHAPPHAIPKKLELLRRRVPEALWFNATDFTVHGAAELSRGIMTARLGTFDLAKKIDDDPDSETHRSMLLKRIRRIHGETLARDFDLNAVIRDDPELEKTRRQLVRTLTAAHGLDMAFYDLTEAIGDADLDDCRREILDSVSPRSGVAVSGVKDERSEPRTEISRKASDEAIATLQNRHAGEISDLHARIERQETAARLELENSRREHASATRAAVEEAERLREEEVGLTKSVLQAETERLRECLERVSGAEDENSKMSIEIAGLKETNANALDESIADLEREIETLIQDHDSTTETSRRVSARNLEESAAGHASEIKNMNGRINDLLFEKERLETNFETEIKGLKRAHDAAKQQKNFLKNYLDLANARLSEETGLLKECAERVRVLEEEKWKMQDEARAEIESSGRKYARTLEEARAMIDDANTLAESKLEEILRGFTDIYRETSVSDLVEPDPKREGGPMEVEGRSTLDALLARLVGVRENLQSLVHDLNKKATVADEIRRALRVPEHAPLAAIPKTLELLRRRVPEERSFNATGFTVHGAEQLSTGLLNARLRSFDLSRSIDDDPDAEGFRIMMLESLPLKIETGAFSRFNLTEEMIPNSPSEEFRKQLVSRLTVLHDLHMTFYDLTEEIEDTNLNELRKELLRSGGFDPDPNQKFENLKLEHAAAMETATEQTERFRRDVESTNRSLEDCFESVEEEKRMKSVDEADRSPEVKHAKSLNEALENVRRLEEKAASRRSRTTTKDREGKMEVKPKKKTATAPKKKTFYNRNSKTKQQNQKYLKLLQYNKRLKADLKKASGSVADAEKENKIFNSLSPVTSENFHEFMTVRSLKELLFQTLFNYYKICFRLKTVEIYTVDFKKMQTVQNIYTKLENLNRQFPEPQDGDTRATYFEILRSYAFEDARLMIATEPPNYDIDNTLGFLNDCIKRIKEDIEIAFNKVNKEYSPRMKTNELNDENYSPRRKKPKVHI